MLRDGVRALPGHVQAHHLDYRDDPSVNNLLSLTSAEVSDAFDSALTVRTGVFGETATRQKG